LNKARRFVATNSQIVNFTNILFTWSKQ